MRFIRRHFAKNIVNDEEDVRPGHLPETFDNVRHFRIAVNGYVSEWDDNSPDDVSEIIESDNYFTIISRGGKHIECIRFDETIGFDFDLI